jgi:hypothetical protein
MCALGATYYPFDPHICLHIQDKTVPPKRWYLSTKLQNVMSQKTIILKKYCPLVNISILKMHGPWIKKTKPTYLSLIGCKRNLIHKNGDNYVRCIVLRLLLWILNMFMCYPYWKYLRTPLLFNIKQSTAYDIKWLQYSVISFISKCYQCNCYST